MSKDFRSKIETKYTTITFHDDYDGKKQFTWIGIELAWLDTAPRDEKLFGHLYDEELLSVLRENLADAVNDVKTDIRIEDVDILINIAEGKKPLAIKIPGIVEAVEAKFDATKADVPVYGGRVTNPQTHCPKCEVQWKETPGFRFSFWDCPSCGAKKEDHAR